MKRAPNPSAGLRVASLSLLLASCASLSGLDGSAEYGCKAPPGVRCDSVSGNYANALQNNLPAQRPRRASSAAAMPPVRANASPAAPAPSAPAGVEAGTAFTAAPLRSPARVLRLWVKPWEDSDHDLVDQSYVYVNVDPGQWLVEHAQQRARDAYVPLRPPRSASLPGPSSSPALDPRLPSTIRAPRLPDAPSQSTITPPDDD